MNEMINPKRFTALEWAEPKKSPVLRHRTILTSKSWFKSIGGFDEDYLVPDMLELGIVGIIPYTKFFFNLDLQKGYLHFYIVDISKILVGAFFVNTARKKVYQN